MRTALKIFLSSFPDKIQYLFILEVEATSLHECKRKLAVKQGFTILSEFF